MSDQKKIVDLGRFEPGFCKIVNGQLAKKIVKSEYLTFFECNFANPGSG